MYVDIFISQEIISIDLTEFDVPVSDKALFYLVLSTAADV